MISTKTVAVITAGIVTVAALFFGQDGPAITAFFGFLAGLGMGSQIADIHEIKNIMNGVIETLGRNITGTAQETSKETA